MRRKWWLTLLSLITRTMSKLSLIYLLVTLVSVVATGGRKCSFFNDWDCKNVGYHCCGFGRKVRCSDSCLRFSCRRDYHCGHGCCKSGVCGHCGVSKIDTATDRKSTKSWRCNDNAECNVGCVCDGGICKYSFLPPTRTTTMRTTNPRTSSSHFSVTKTIVTSVTCFVLTLSIIVFVLVHYYKRHRRQSSRRVRATTRDFSVSSEFAQTNNWPAEMSVNPVRSSRKPPPYNITLQADSDVPPPPYESVVNSGYHK